jgi:hypothetical protein
MTCALSQAIHGFQRLETLERGITQTRAHQSAVDTVGVVYLAQVANLATRFCVTLRPGHQTSLAALAGRPRRV